MSLDDMAHMADQERKREREVGDGVEGNYGTVTIPLKQWREKNAELEKIEMDKTIAVTLCNSLAEENTVKDARIATLETDICLWIDGSDGFERRVEELEAQNERLALVRDGLREALEQVRSNVGGLHVCHIIDEALKGAGDGRTDTRSEGDTTTTSTQHDALGSGSIEDSIRLKPLKLHNGLSSENWGKSVVTIEQWSAEVVQQINALGKRGTVHE